MASRLRSYRDRRNPLRSAAAAPPFRHGDPNVAPAAGRGLASWRPRPMGVPCRRRALLRSLPARLFERCHPEGRQSTGSSNTPQAPPLFVLSTLARGHAGRAARFHCAFDLPPRPGFRFHANLRPQIHRRRRARLRRRYDSHGRVHERRRLPPASPAQRRSRPAPAVLARTERRLAIPGRQRHPASPPQKEITYLLAYTAGAARDDAADFDEQPLDPRNTRSDWSRSRQYQAHRGVASGIFELPFDASGCARVAAETR